MTTSLATAQNRVEWVGGTPGHETSWDTPRNWSTNHVPDEFSLVVIPNKNDGRQSHPIIDHDVKVVSLEIQSGAELIVTESGHLIIDGKDTYSEGLVVFGGNINNTGEISVRNIDAKSISWGSSLAGVVLTASKSPKNHGQ